MSIFNPSQFSSYIITSEEDSVPGFQGSLYWNGFYSLLHDTNPQFEALTTSIERPDLLQIPIYGDTGATSKQPGKAKDAIVERPAGGGGANEVKSLKAATSPSLSTSAAPASETIDDLSGKGSEAQVVTISGAALQELKRGHSGSDSLSNNEPRPTSAGAASSAEDDIIAKPVTRGGNVAAAIAVKADNDDNDGGDNTGDLTTAKKLRKLSSRAKHFNLF